MIAIEQQIAAVEIVFANQRGHAENLADLVGRNRRTQAEYDVVAERLPALEAAVATLKWVAANQSTIRTVAAEKAA